MVTCSSISSQINLMLDANSIKGDFSCIILDKNSTNISKNKHENNYLTLLLAFLSDK